MDSFPCPHVERGFAGRGFRVGEAENGGYRSLRTFDSELRRLPPRSERDVFGKTDHSGGNSMLPTKLQIQALDVTLFATLRIFFRSAGEGLFDVRRDSSRSCSARYSWGIKCILLPHVNRVDRLKPIDAQNTLTFGIEGCASLGTVLVVPSHPPSHTAQGSTYFFYQQWDEHAANG